MADEKKADKQAADSGSDAKDAARQKMQAALDSNRADYGSTGPDSDDEVSVDGSLEADIESRQTKTEVHEENKKKSKKEKLDTSILKNVKVYSPYHVYYDADANSVSAENLTGPFDVLPGHKAFMSLLIPSEIVIRSDRGEEKIKNDRAVMHVRNNMVTIFLDV